MALTAGGRHGASGAPHIDGGDPADAAALVPEAPGRADPGHAGHAGRRVLEPRELPDDLPLGDGAAGERERTQGAKSSRARSTSTSTRCPSPAGKVLKRQLPEPYWANRERCVA
jgi:hypothetical protein